MTEESDKPWPLVVTYTAEVEAERNCPPEALLESAMLILHLTARKMLEEAGRLQDVKRFKLYCYNDKE